MRHGLPIYVVAIALIAGAAPPTLACILATPHYGRSASDTYLIATGASSVVVASRGTVAANPETAGDGTKPEIFGHVVRVERVTGASAEEIESALRDSRREAVLVPWVHDDACFPAEWGRDAWSPKEPGAYIADLRKREFWVNALPTFDIFYAWDQPYPQQRFFSDEIESARPKNQAEALSPAEYLEFHAALPLIDDYDRAPDDALRHLREWSASHSALANRWPAKAMLSVTERYLAGKKPSHDAFKVERDPGVSCTRKPEEVASIAGVQAGATLRCTTKDKLIESFGPDGKLIRTVIWLVSTPPDWWAIEDGTGNTVGRGGAGAGSRGVPTPAPISIQP